MTTELKEKLLKVQSELKAPKGQYNSFGKYKYRSCEDILEAVKPLLAKHGLVLTISDDIVVVGNRYYIKATATITDGTSEVSTTAFAREEETKKGMDGSQVTGASSSYARKYCLNGLLAIDDTKDSDTTNTHGKETDTKLLKQAVAEVRACTSSAKVGEVWNKYPKLKTNEEFKTVVASVGKILKAQEK